MQANTCTSGVDPYNIINDNLAGGGLLSERNRQLLASVVSATGEAEALDAAMGPLDRGHKGNSPV